MAKDDQCVPFTAKKDQGGGWSLMGKLNGLHTGLQPPQHKTQSVEEEKQSPERTPGARSRDGKQRRINRREERRAEGAWCTLPSSANQTSPSTCLGCHEERGREKPGVRFSIRRRESASSSSPGLRMPTSLLFLGSPRAFASHLV